MLHQLHWLVPLWLQIKIQKVEAEAHKVWTRSTKELTESLSQQLSNKRRSIYNAQMLYKCCSKISNFFSITISSKIPFHCLGRRCWEFDNCLILSLVSTLFALNDWKKGGLWTDNNNCHYLFFWQAAGHPFLINSPQQLREVWCPKIVNQGHYHMFIRNFMVLLKVLFEELRLDQKCKKKLARTSIKNYKSTSEAVVSSIVDYTSTTYNLTAASLSDYICGV